MGGQLSQMPRQLRQLPTHWRSHLLNPWLDRLTNHLPSEALLVDSSDHAIRVDDETIWEYLHRYVTASHTQKLLLQLWWRRRRPTWCLRVRRPAIRSESMRVSTSCIQGFRRSTPVAGRPAGEVVVPAGRAVPISSSHSRHAAIGLPADASSRAEAARGGRLLPVGDELRP